ncbi:type 2 lactosamine alpha-2,3-sialyltransferase-like isoform X1 [Leucoraja erinacea]|uniref:type 2 lactosamine alpha-2,3-sialyltransferase-like isoform X1 n=1 Tax=Leucoraja erinaceus TaxID=7782 RepID=UPI002456C1F1|nr:type 2 lactosamine alpha-2,3-sialyltransferase-like isoform X1 [Leucoraja erinacea]XP_055500972.1 type 2 lactosamine alpha-2,3-sialyltransferase-like isoform X1 [Leucoraja erinacea]XP_055500973.1 type 2 lactosamine alpha-2,3-sialyltransferase-like isoform X1 [Leucoraja erinacea]XP_055500974.1 type 2 lactosamine alpha-2,3-sialyltransferase-like isoform X1 [Leucoraja erinacea]
MKRRRYLKLSVVLLVILGSTYYLINEKIQFRSGVYGRNFALLLPFAGVKKTEDVEATKSESKNPFLCSSDIGHKSWPANALAKPETLPFGTLSTERYFKTILENLETCDLPHQLKNLSCLRCIVIGNGAVLRNRNLGKKINSYDIVIRLNNGPVIGYENDVGNKTTFRLCYPESVFIDRSSRDDNTTMVFVPFKTVDLRWLKEVLLKKRVSLRGFWKKPPLELIYKKAQVRVLNPSVVQKAAFELLHLPKVVAWPKPPQYPTTGIIALSMALTMCDEVHVAGFKYDAKNRNGTLHYYGNETMATMEKTQYHNITAEQMLLNKLKLSNRIFDLTGSY